MNNEGEKLTVTTYLLQKRYPFLPEVRPWFQDTLKFKADF